MRQFPLHALVVDLIIGYRRLQRRIPVDHVGNDADGEHVSVDRYKAIRKLDALQEMLLDDMDARRYVRMRNRYNWINDTSS